MGKSKKAPKIRRTWDINPKTQVTPNKKRNSQGVDDSVCPCLGTGKARVISMKNGKLAEKIEECPFCEGTGVL